MGTSTRYGGPANGLLPSWLDNPTAPPPAAPATAPDGAADPAPVPPTAPMRGGLLNAPRSAFTSFARTGSSDRLRRGLSGYVNGVGGAGGATRRMGSSRNTASALFGIASALRGPGGPAAALAPYGLANLSGRPAVEVFERLMDAMCPPGGNVDEAIARAGMLQAIEMLAEADVGIFEDLTPEQMQEFVAEFITGAIEARVMNDVGTRAIELPDDISAVENIQSQLHDAIAGCVRETIANTAGGIAGMSATQIARLTDSVYHGAFELLSAMAESI